MKFSFRKGEGDYSVTLTQSKKMYFSKDGKNTITNTPQNALINYRLEVKNDRAEKIFILKGTHISNYVQSSNSVYPHAKDERLFNSFFNQLHEYLPDMMEKIQTNRYPAATYIETIELPPTINVDSNIEVIIDILRNLRDILEVLSERTIIPDYIYILLNLYNEGVDLQIEKLLIDGQFKRYPEKIKINENEVSYFYKLKL